MIECKDIDYILAISKYNNISKAADALFISQPALTKYLKNLEKRLGVELFYRGRKQFRLTPIGELYVAYAKEIVVTKEHLEKEINRFKENDFSLLRIGFSCTGIRLFVFRAVQMIRALNPSLKITLSELTSDEIEDRLLSRTLDIGFINLPNRSPELTTQLIMEEDVLLAVPSVHPLSSLGTHCYSKKFPLIDLGNLKNDSFVLRNTGTRFRCLTDNLFAACNFYPEIVTTTRNNFSCIELAENEKLCTFTTETFTGFLKDPHSMHFFIAGPNPQKVSIGLAYRKDVPLSFFTQQLIYAIDNLINLASDIPQEKSPS